MGETTLLSRVSRTPVLRRKQSSGKVSDPVKRYSLTIVGLSTLIDAFLMLCDLKRHSPATIENYRYRLSRILWLAERLGWTEVGPVELQKFFQYLVHGHEQKGGRWGNPQQTKPLSPGSSKTFHVTIRTFFTWCVAEGELDASPMDRLPTPVHRADQIQPFTEAQANALLAATKKTMNPRRDEAIVTVFLDCGLRISELCALTIGDVNFGRAEIAVREAKGGKSRFCPIGRNCKRALWAYIQSDRRKADEAEPLFLSDRGPGAGAGFLQRRGLALLIERLGKRAKITGVRCSAHSLRHTFAIMYLRNGGNVFSLKTALGHENLSMTNRYVAIAQADLATVHRSSSPMDRLRGK